ncbi:hypothetical protein [Corynebacterium bovis]|uniref:Nuclear transport factor 2 family protein n=1 Tax=Corynebacterium bovis TaxID=36808 RepID=A0A3R8QHX7_9CORY|nr:hypothetical protein [Corynebacterium bovis]RRO92106.1 hypothetical protein CXF40_04625 [Corynebacterium bovis]RRO95692.1 hypothetical protein CXF31_08410 [Corynebacterium bovis]RRO98833.1 hypothetical protein CXF39_10110 [Corynebacterium bovis]RRQ00635.1 hypothetical protein CXF41_06580 [Corynebacterium bovis]RRQ04098.1 hypothetical protein CXF42_05115 [Corynebacterium bovis]
MPVASNRRLAALIEELVGGTEPLEAIADRQLTPDYRQRVNGRWTARDAVLAHFAQLREAARSVEVTVLDEGTTTRPGDAGAPAPADGTAADTTADTGYAERHIVSVTLADGRRSENEVYIFARLAADGRIRSLEEVILPLTDDADDAADPGTSTDATGR